MKVNDVHINPEASFVELSPADQQKSLDVLNLLILATDGYSNTIVNKTKNSIEALKVLATYHDPDSNSRRVQAQRKLQTMKYKTQRNFSEFVCEMLEIFDDIDRHSGGEQMTEAARVTQILLALPEELDTVRKSFTSPNGEFTVTALINYVNELNIQEKLQPTTESGMLSTTQRDGQSRSSRIDSRAHDTYHTKGNYTRRDPSTNRYRSSSRPTSQSRDRRDERSDDKYRNRSKNRHRSTSREPSALGKRDKVLMTTCSPEKADSTRSQYDHGGYLVKFEGKPALDPAIGPTEIFSPKKLNRKQRRAAKKLHLEMQRALPDLRKTLNNRPECSTQRRHRQAPPNQNDLTQFKYAMKNAAQISLLKDSVSLAGKDLSQLGKQGLVTIKNSGKRKVSFVEPLTTNARLSPKYSAKIPRPSSPLTTHEILFAAQASKNSKAAAVADEMKCNGNAEMYKEIFTIINDSIVDSALPHTKAELVTPMNYEAPPKYFDDADIPYEDELLIISYDNDEMSDNEIEQEIKSIENYSLSSHTSNNNCKENWALDSGASVHIGVNEHKFHELEYGDFGSVTIANGSKIKSAGKGTVLLTVDTDDGPTMLRLEDVIFVPEMSINLVSVKSLGLIKNGTRDPPSVLFNKNDAYLQVDDNLIKIATWRDNLYIINQATYRASPCVHEWHNRIAHRNIADIKRAAASMNIKISRCACIDDCDACLRGKMPYKPFNHTAEKPENPMDIVVTDLAGPIEMKSHAGSRYYMTMIDLATDYVEIRCLHHKSDATEALKGYIEKQENLTGRRLRCLRSDRGLEYCNRELSTYLMSKGITHQLTCSESPQSNGVAERWNRTLADAMRTQLIAHSLSKELWSEALHHTVYSLNRLPRQNQIAPPIERFYGRPFEHQFYEFGHQVYVAERKAKLTKLTERAKPMIFVGVDDKSKGFRVWDGYRVWVERNVHFVSSNGPAHQQYIENSLWIPPRWCDGKPEDDQTNENLEAISKILPAEPRRSERIRNQNLLNNNCLLILPSGSEPTTYKQALTCEDKDKWVDAIKDELINCVKRKIWRKEKRPEKANVVGSKWVFKLKRDEHGNIKQYKARVVAQGFSQKEGIDYEETFAAVATSAALRLMLLKASKEKLCARQFDVTAAFLNGELAELIYMKPPPGFEEGDYVLKLDKSIYGLKQAAHVWYNTLTNALHEIGFETSATDQCLHIYKLGEQRAYVIHHVDDLLCIGTSNELISEIAAKLNNFFELKDMGEVHHFLGLDIKRDGKGCFSLSQQSYIESIAQNHNLEDMKPQKLPMSSAFYKLHHGELLDNNTEYRSLLGSLLYVAVNSRPDIAAPINILAQKTSKPTQTDFQQLKQILAYLMGSKTTRLKLFSLNPDMPALEGFSDADWAEDKETRKSISGILCRVHGAPIIWSSKKQGCVATSTTEAEYYAVGETIKNLIWLKQLMLDMELMVEDPITLHCDNQSCLKLMTRDNTKRSKHFDIRYHFIRDLVKRGFIKLAYIESESNPADLLTKPMNVNKLQLMLKLHDMEPEALNSVSVNK